MGSRGLVRPMGHAMSPSRPHRALISHTPAPTSGTFHTLSLECVLLTQDSSYKITVNYNDVHANENE